MLPLSEFPPIFLLVFAVAFGLAGGSFLNVVIYRLPLGQSVATPPSHCPACGARIRIIDNLPIVSFLLLRGRARCCKASIAVRYPLVELLGGLLAAAVLLLIVGQLPPETSILRALALFALYLLFGLALLALSFIDLEHMLLPDSLTLGCAVIGLASAGVRGLGYGQSLLGAVLGFAIIFVPFVWLHGLLRGYPGMGHGDAKLTLLAGAWLGWQGALFALFAGAIQATVVTLTLYVVQGRIEEPVAVTREREEWEAAIAQAEGEERARLEHERDLDPVLRAPEEGLGKARLPFGPFLALATLEYALLYPAGLGTVLEALFPLSP